MTHHAAHTVRMIAIMDMAADGLALHDARGRLLHRNAALNRLFAGSCAGALRSAVTRTARAIALLRGPGAEPHEAIVRQKVRTGDGDFVVRATRTRPGPSAEILVRVQRDPTPRDAVADEASGLTVREREVAMLLAAGASSKEVAEELGVTIHTARRHTERVLRKLRLNSRSQVAARMLGMERRGGERRKSHE